LLALKEEPAKATPGGRGSVEKLLEAVDNFLPSPARALDKPFLMPVEDVFNISGRGAVVTGRIEQGLCKIGDEIQLVGGPKGLVKTAVSGIEMFKKEMTNAQAGDNVGILLRGLKREDVSRGIIVCKPNICHPFKKFRMKAYVLGTDEGGRKKPFGNNYRPQFFIRTANITGTVILPKDKMAMPGDSIEFDVELETATVIEDNMKIAIREGQLTVAAGVITKVDKGELDKKKK